MDSTYSLRISEALQNPLRKQTSCNSIRRSVSGMKNLLPLRLLSPPLPEKDFWAAFGPNSMSFAPRRHSRGIPAPLKVHKNTRQASLNKYRDTPIYTEAGSPLFGTRAYFTSEDLSHGLIAPEPTPKQQDHPTQGQPRHYKKAFTGSQYGHSKSLSEDSDLSQASDMSQAENRSSGLSFQCAGNPLLLSESTMPWPGDTPNSRSGPSSNLSQTVVQHPFDEFVEPNSRVNKWLSDTRDFDSDDDDEMLSCATALAPAKAHVINVNHLSGQTLRIPPRSSSIGQVFNTDVSKRASWTSFVDSPPRTSIEQWDGDEATFGHPSIPPMWNHQTIDLAMTSPPLTPQGGFSFPLPHPPPLEPQWCDKGENSPCPPPSPRPSTAPIIDLPSETLNILFSLEETTDDFPSTMLLLDSPIISQIRSQLFPESKSQTQPRPEPQSRLPLPSPKFQTKYYTPPPSTATTYHPLQRRRTMRLPSRSRTDTPRTSRSNPNLRHGSNTPWLSTPKHEDEVEEEEEEINLEPLSHIFPNSSRTMRSALHAHLLSHIYISSLLTSTSTSPSQPPSTQSTQIISRKAASFLGLDLNSIHELCIVNSSQRSDRGRDVDGVYLEWLRGGLKRCIWALVVVMDEGGLDGGVAGEVVERAQRGVGISGVLLRSLEEVVLGWEII